MSDRTLASVRRVEQLHPIDGADRIEAAVVGGWTVVVRKGEFAPGDKAVYFEIDSVPPDEPQYRFLWAKKGETPGPGERPRKFRLRTVKLRGQLSQGLLLPMDVVGVDPDTPEGTDLTDDLGVTKYDPPLPAGMGAARGAYPTRWVPKNDEVRVQSSPELLGELAGEPWVATVKMDGTSSTYLINPDDGEFHACGRNWSVTDGQNAYWSVARRYGLAEKLAAIKGRVALLGEICGPGIQKNPAGLDQVSWFCFGAYDISEGRDLGHDELVALCDELDLPMVPVAAEGDHFHLDVGELLELAEGTYPGTDRPREGVVVRPKSYRYSPTLGRGLSLKAVANSYLLSEKD